ncbi:PadR family transcriptional regulator [Streptomyces sp. SID3343]|uniref:PadR family transcriptional regulator n=1 Tax=Streptomyces sp. SID3343 TaxID=2690260 RepID=UPI00136DF89F|nr:PadR family transcriptional regulator [Streptomyces sp. SID3343]MYW00730.1 PadR family transcriptional regulator [Streptomyces sp. SID3343]
MTPVFGHGRLRLYLLKLLDESPRHGYEVIRLLHDRFMGLYAPSAGTVYPRLAKLEQEGLVEHSVEGGRKVYRITDAGRTELGERAAELEQLEAQIHESVYERAREIRDEVRTSAQSLREELGEAVREVRGASRPADGPGGPTGARSRGKKAAAEPNSPWGPVFSQKMADLAEGLAHNLVDLAGKRGVHELERELRRRFGGEAAGGEGGGRDATRRNRPTERVDLDLDPDAWAAETDRPGRATGPARPESPDADERDERKGSKRAKGSKESKGAKGAGSERCSSEGFDVERIVDRLRGEIGPLAHRAGVTADQVDRARDVVVTALRELREIFDERDRPNKRS